MLLYTFETYLPRPYKAIGLAYESLFEGSLEVKLPTIWTDEKQSRAEAERRGRF